MAWSAARRARFVERYGPWAVVTGASSGIGAELARQLAALGISVALVARRRDRLEALAADLREAHAVEARVCVHDLADPSSIDALSTALADVDLGLVVANAGLGWKGSFLEQDPAALRHMIEVNCQAPAAIVRALGPRLVSRGRGGVVIVSSTGAFQGLPWSATYGATKAFDLALGEALHVELGASGVDVVTLAPGGTDTEGPMNRRCQHRAAAGGETLARGPGAVTAEGRNEATNTGVDPAKVPGKLMSVTPVVAAALAGLGRVSIVVPGAANRLGVFATRLLPRRTSARAAGRIMRRVMR